MPARASELEARVRWPEGFASGSENRRALLVLSSLRGLTPRKLGELAERERTAAACLAAIRAGRVGSAADHGHARRLEPDAIQGALTACGARMLAPGTREWVPGLEELRDPPAALFVRGGSLLELAPRVSIVGARNCSDLGREMSRSLGRGLADAGVCVVSGAARGVDSASHEGALDAGGTTIAVLGSGIDVAYPRGSARLLARIERAGAIVSEYAAGVPAEPFRFPARNRLIAALGRAVVVVEGADGSGSRISADHALDLGREVYAVPGAVNNPLAQVPLDLIHSGAGLIRGIEDLLDGLRLAGGGSIAALSSPQLSAVEEVVASRLAGLTLPEAVARAIGLSIPEVVAVLMDLEMKGVVRSVGGRFERRLSG